MEQKEVNKYKNFWNFVLDNTEIDKFVKSNKNNVLSYIYVTAELKKTMLGMSDSTKFVLNIPTDLSRMIKEGKAQFDQSSKISGNYTPNIRIKGEKGIAGQATIKKCSNLDIWTNTATNLASVMMVLSFNDKLNNITEKVEEIKMKQDCQNMGIIIGSFNDAINAYNSNSIADIMLTNASNDISKGLATLFLEIESLWKIQTTCPKTYKEVIIQSLLHFTSSRLGYYTDNYYELVHKIRLYSYFLMMYDMINSCIPGRRDSIICNHKTFCNYLNDRIDKKFISYTNDILEKECEEIIRLKENANEMYQKMHTYNNQDYLSIDFDKNDLKLISETY